ncbi:MAG TPA: hypothetical protein PKY30_09930 [Myxococcota bacterium]|nr:hypothetical protein [Myxococcota bacterium]HNH47347.1 hypothetical protein [Myxococcota bacterium]
MILLLSAALAAPQGALALGGALSSGYDHGSAYTSYSPMLAGELENRFGPIEGWVGFSLSGLLSSEWGTRSLSAPAQLELGLGFGNSNFSLGGLCGVGVGGTLFGGYAQAMFPVKKQSRVFGVEGRIFMLPAQEDLAAALLIRTEWRQVAKSKKKKGRDSKDNYHEAPY